MNAKLRLLISVLLIALTLGLGATVARHWGRTTFAGEERPPYEFVGPIVSLPEGMIGTWQVGNTPVEVTRKTQIEALAGPPQEGTWVRVRAVQVGDTLEAQTVQILPPDELPEYVDLHGVVLKVHGEIWNVSGRQVRVPASARIIGDISPTGAVATVRGHMEGTTLVADVILLSSATDEANRVEFVGQLEAVRGNTWVVDGVEVQAPKEVTPPPLGSLVSVRGQMVDTNRVSAERLAVEENPPTFLEGWLVDANNATQTWRILVSDPASAVGYEMTLAVPEDTPVDERAGLARPGARVQVVAQATGQGTMTATFARVLDAPRTYLTGTLVYIPTDPYAFPWTVDNTRVWVKPSTVLDRPLSEFRLGDRVAVSGVQQEDGTVVAQMLSHSKR